MKAIAHFLHGQLLIGLGVGILTSIGFGLMYIVLTTLVVGLIFGE